MTQQEIVDALEVLGAEHLTAYRKAQERAWMLAKGA
jgi:hypothetical protein